MAHSQPRGRASSCRVVVATPEQMPGSRRRSPVDARHPAAPAAAGRRQRLPGDGLVPAARRQKASEAEGRRDRSEPAVDSPVFGRGAPGRKGAPRASFPWPCSSGQGRDSTWIRPSARPTRCSAEKKKKKFFEFPYGLKIIKCQSSFSLQ